MTGYPRVRDVRPVEAPPPIAVRYFYTSPLAIDDPLSPLPPPLTGSSAGRRHAARPFSTYDNDALDETWLQLRKKILQFNEELGEKASAHPAVERLKRKRGQSASTPGDDRSAAVRARMISSRATFRTQYSTSMESPGRAVAASSSAEARGPSLASSLRALEPTESVLGLEPSTTGMPFIRAPSRGDMAQLRKSQTMHEKQRPRPREMDSYVWDDRDLPAGGKNKGTAGTSPSPKTGPSAKVPVGVSRLHHVVMDAESIRMEPIYWSPVHDIADVVRGTWFYKDTMMPVEVDVANMLEAGFIELKPWTQTWADELNSAVEVGAAGEMKILHKLWPTKPKVPDSRPSTSREMEGVARKYVAAVAGPWYEWLTMHSSLSERSDPEQGRQDTIEHACNLIDIASGPDGPDNKAAGDPSYSQDGRKHTYLKAGVVYTGNTDAYLLRPSLQPSDYYGRRPFANYIRKGRSIGIPVCRGFDQKTWDTLHPSKTTPLARSARHGVSTSHSGTLPARRQKLDPTLAQSERPQVTDLVLVIHGIGQKLSERIETFHFTHAINTFRREVNVELGTPSVKGHLRKDMGGIMVLPVIGSEPA